MHPVAQICCLTLAEVLQAHKVTSWALPNVSLRCSGTDTFNYTSVRIRLLSLFSFARVSRKKVTSELQRWKHLRGHGRRISEAPWLRPPRPWSLVTAFFLQFSRKKLHQKVCSRRLPLGLGEKDHFLQMKSSSRDQKQRLSVRISAREIGLALNSRDLPHAPPETARSGGG